MHCWSCSSYEPTRQAFRDALTRIWHRQICLAQYLLRGSVDAVKLSQGTLFSTLKQVFATVASHVPAQLLELFGVLLVGDRSDGDGAAALQDGLQLGTLKILNNTYLVHALQALPCQRH